MKTSLWMSLTTLLICQSNLGFAMGELPIPDIQAGGSDTPIAIVNGTPAEITVSLDPGEMDGSSGDWWVYAKSTSGNYYYKYPEGWIRGQGVTYQGPFFAMPPYTVLNTSTLPNGIYTFYFQVDMNANEQIENGNVDSIEVGIGSTPGNIYYIPNLGMMTFYKLSPGTDLPGTFLMGSSTSEPGHWIDETQHEVTLNTPFYMQTTEVTQGQWKTLMGEENPSHFSSCGDHCPVENVTWDDAQKFIAELNTQGIGTFRLPTEAEWEYAARGGTQTAYFFGSTESNAGDYAWYAANSNSSTHSTARKLHNPWGFFDIQGNVWEWVEDWYGHFTAEPVTNPTGPTEGIYRVIRGGSYKSNTTSLRSASRHGALPTLKAYDVGFRIVMADPEEPPASETHRSASGQKNSRFKKRVLEY